MTIASASHIHQPATLPLQPSAARTLGRGIAIVLALAVYGLLSLHLLVSAVGLGQGPSDVDATSTARPVIVEMVDREPAKPRSNAGAPAQPVPGFVPRDVDN